MKDIKLNYDYIIIGAGVSGCIVAERLCSRGKNVLLLEAGKFFYSKNFLTKEVDSNSQMYWNGGIELNSNASIGLIRPKVVGGGSIINGGLLDPFDDLALEGFKDITDIDFFSLNSLNPYYEKINSLTTIEKIPEEYANLNSKIFKQGFKANGFQCASLERGQKNCPYSDGVDCITCLSGCPTNSKQSTMTTYLREALKNGAKIFSEFKVKQVDNSSRESIKVSGHDKNLKQWTFSCNKLILASGAIGNSKLLINSGFKNKNIGKNFYTHPQYMLMAEFDHEVNAYKGPLQNYKSDDLNFRKKGFKLENVFAPPAAISALFNGVGDEFFSCLKNINKFGSIEVCIRDENPGEIKVGRNNKTIVYKELSDLDKKKRDLGFDAIKNILYSQGAKRVIEGDFGIGLHLMGGCSIGSEEKKSVFAPDFSMYEDKRISCADSSIFPNAPGINPSLTIMALSIKFAEELHE